MIIIIIDQNRWQLIKIDENRYSQLFRSSIFIDFRYQSIDCYRLISIAIDFIDSRFSSIGHAGIRSRYYTIQRVDCRSQQLLVLLSHYPTYKTYFKQKTTRDTIDITKYDATPIVCWILYFTRTCLSLLFFEWASTSSPFRRLFFGFVSFSCNKIQDKSIKTYYFIRKTSRIINKAEFTGIFNVFFIQPPFIVQSVRHIWSIWRETGHQLVPRVSVPTVQQQGRIV